MSYQINAAIQLLPLNGNDKYGIIDRAITLIQESGLNHRVCPFETVVEGRADLVYSLIRKIQDSTLASGCDELLLNVKIHAATRDLKFADKTDKFEREV
jgi:uncharacterized protein YqgV (UPF0045/DUF77 family)